jgi:hypothetical protein
MEYSVVDGVLLESGPVSRAYFPGLSPQLVSEFAKLGEGDESKAMTFAASWGLLGRWSLIFNAPDLSAEARSEALGRGRGEPLTWLWAHVRGVRVCLNLLGYLQSSNFDGLNRYMQTLSAADGTYPQFIFGRRYGIDSFVWIGEGAPEAIAADAICTVVSSNLAHIGVSLEPIYVEGKTGFQIGQQINTLAEYIYWHLAKLAAASGELARCRACGALFERKDARQEFCPPSRWVLQNGKHAGPRESSCAKRARARRLRAEKAR